MTSRRVALVLVAVLLLAACVRMRSIYQRFELPKELDPQTEQEVFRGVVESLRSQPFVDELKNRFPSLTQEKLLRTDIRWDVVTTASSRSFFISVGVKDTTDFPEAGALVDFSLEYGKARAQTLLGKAKPRG